MAEIPLSRVHIAGLSITIGPLLRQRCAWCGTVLSDYDLTRMMIPVGQDRGGPSGWPTGGLIAVDGNMSWVVAHLDGDDLPAESCARTDDQVTL